jgi:hypothetical protein
MALKRLDRGQFRIGADRLLEFFGDPALRALFHQFSAAFTQAGAGVPWYWFFRDAGGLPLPSSVLDPHGEIELQGPRAFAVQGFDDRLMRA